MLNVFRFHRNIRLFKRYRTVLTVLVKYGFGHIVDQLNLGGYLELGRKIVTGGPHHGETQGMTPPERLRLALEELGTTFIKMGQILSTRPDLIPNDFTEEFRKLQNDVPAVPFEELRAQFEKELGHPIAEVFQKFETKPVAAASIAQVYQGVLISGEKVAVKIRRPNIREIVETDLEIMLGLAQRIRNYFPHWEIYDPVGIVTDFRRTILRELDFTREAHAIDRFTQNFKDDATVYIPKVFWHATGESALTMEFIHGIKVTDIAALQKGGYDLKAIAYNGAHAILRQILEFGYFHGDPHPGNIFILPGNVVCMLDYGMTGRLDPTMKQQLSDLLNAVLRRDVNHLVEILRNSVELSDNINLYELRSDLTEFLDDYYGLPLNEIHTGQLLVDFSAILNRYRIKFPSSLMILAKSLVTVEGIGRQLDPEFNMVEMLSPLITRLIRERFSPVEMSREALDIVTNYSGLFKQLPHDIRELLTRLNKDKFRIDLRHHGFEKMMADLDKASNRISFSLLISALIVGSSLIMQTDKGPHFFGFPTLGLLGYSVAAILGLWLAIAILRSGKL
ncbi:MAG: AarF/ABC1/UbiB kinase family protein [bacterium]|nr:AarF/ABC1/UbiB kinase family protein [bacterium]